MVVRAILAFFSLCSLLRSASAYQSPTTLVRRMAETAAVNAQLMKIDEHGHYHQERSAATQVNAKDSSSGVIMTASSINAVSARANTQKHAHAPPGRIYLDLGANWANTLRLFEDIGTKRSETPWEVYAFEASPLVQPYLEKFTAWLNGQGAKPPVTVPPSGSSDHLNMFATRYGCPTRATQGWDAMRSCMFQLFRKQLNELKPDPSLNSTDLIRSRLEIAKEASTAENRFVVIPAAVGASSGTLEFGMVIAEQMIRGGAADAQTGTTMSVPMIDFPKWLVQSFTQEDYILVKMDVEGAEFPILNTLLHGPNGCLIDVLALECHPSAGDCAKLSQKLRQHPCISVMTENDLNVGDKETEYKGWDHYSSPDVYFAEDPREVA